MPRPLGPRFISKISFFLIFAVSLLNGCSSVQYLYQAGKGQLELSNSSRPIDEVLKDEKTPSKLRVLLSEIPGVKKFSEESGLKPTKNYTDYVQLHRSAATYVVSACEPLKFKSKEWHFPIVGSFPYLGWFDLGEAKKYGEELKKEGLDVDVRGARAFSTLGWFRDAILSTMIPEGEEALGELVDVVIHESVHATLYISGQAYFNESLAMFVAEGLTPVYLEKIRGKDSPERKAYVSLETEYAEREKVLHQAYNSLDQLYSSSRPDPEKLEEKKAILDKLKVDLKSGRDYNNATLIQFRTYGVGRAEFGELLKVCGSDWRRFMRTLSRIKWEAFSKPQQEDLAPVILPLAREGCQ